LVVGLCIEDLRQSGKVAWDRDWLKILLIRLSLFSTHLASPSCPAAFLWFTFFITRLISHSSIISCGNSRQVVVVLLLLVSPQNGHGSAPPLAGDVLEKLPYLLGVVAP